jgi:hypothetical protein
MLVDMSTRLAFSMLNVSGFATNLTDVLLLLLIMSERALSLSSSSISLCMTSLVGVGNFASGWKILANPLNRPASPVSLRPMLPTSLGKYRYRSASPEAGMSSITTSNVFSRSTSSTFKSENNWVIPGNIAIS